MRGLLWKEWHEQRWKLAFGSLMLAAFALIGLRARVIADETLLRCVCGIAVLLLPMLSSTGLVPAERSDGTLESLLALPVQAWRILIAKTLMGLALCAGPIVLAAIVSFAVSGGREMSAGAMAGMFARTLLATLSLFFWMFALSVRLPTETRAALVAVGVLVSWLIVSLGLYGAGPRGTEPSLLWATDPFFLFFIGTGSQSSVLAVAICMQAIIALALWLWAVRQFGKPLEGGS
jgi:hypothetical protein